MSTEPTTEPDPDAEAYRWLRDEIGKTMADPLRWDGDDAEEAILARYVQWLAAEQERLSAALRQIAARCACGPSSHGCSSVIARRALEAHRG